MSQQPYDTGHNLLVVILTLWYSKENKHGEPSTEYRVLHETMNTQIAKGSSVIP